MMQYGRQDQDNVKDLGLLVIRLGLGVMFILHGFPKLLGGIENWKMLGGQMKYLGIDYVPAFWGFMAAITETIGGLLMLLGLFFRPAMVFLMATMLVAALMHIGEAHGFAKIAHPVELGIVFTGLLLSGPGKYSLDAKFFGKRRRM